VYLSAVNSQRAFHPQGEVATARAAASRSALMMLSTGASTSVEDVIRARGGPVWQQLYATDDWNVTRAIVDLTWDFLKRLRDYVSVKLLVKGIVTAEDAALCVTHGADGVIVSNHGGRNEETLRSTFECLPEVVASVAGRVRVLLDGGVRRGTDVFKALALGASAVGIGRPQVWGLAAFGQQGVEAVIDTFAKELRLIMRQAGT
jgi:isopentenyl diphosphate isomerase/L-lactate dehydrogenase-like FMN-dependent dehydrogenase